MVDGRDVESTSGDICREEDGIRYALEPIRSVRISIRTLGRARHEKRRVIRAYQGSSTSAFAPTENAEGTL